jgi:hypothetical protein
MDAAQATEAPPDAGGILFSEPDQLPDGAPPVTLISGEGGAGETMMVPQMAWSLAVEQKRYSARRWRIED